MDGACKQIVLRFFLQKGYRINLNFIIIMNKRVLFYSSVNDKDLFNIQRFYQVDISILEQLGYQVLLSNRISDSFKFWKYDFVFAYFYRYAFFVALVARIFGRNTYFTGGIDSLDRNLVSHKDYIVQRILFRLCYLLSKSCIIVSKTDEANVRTIVSGQKLTYSEHTIETALFDCNLNEKENIFVTIGWQATIGNVQRKGMDTAIRLYAKLQEMPEYHGSVLYIIGKKGEGSIYLEKIVKDLGISKKVIFTGSVSEEEKIQYLKKSKIYFQLSKFEGFGVASLEALCAKNIVIHSGKGGLSNPIYCNGILVNIDCSIEQIAEEVKRRLDSFDMTQLETVHKIICNFYNNDRRKNDFCRIINERL